MNYWFKLVICTLALINCTIVEASRNMTLRCIKVYSDQIQHLSTGEIQAIFKTPKATYKIYGELDLKGGSLSFPEKSNVVFYENSGIRNGGIFFNDTWLKNPTFSNISRLNGQIRNKEIYASWFHSSDATQVLRFILSQNTNNIIINLEDRTYEINSLEGITKVENETAFVRHVNQSGLKVQGNGARIIDNSSKKAIGGKLYSLMSFDNCKDVSITNLTFHWKEKAELGRYVEGIIVIRTYNECSQFDININVENAGRGVYSGKWNYVNGKSRRGLCDSKIIVNAKNVGYPIAIEKGTELDLEACYDNVHRGMYLAGVTDSKVFIKGKNVVTTKVHLLLTDTMDADGWYFCDNIDATIIDTGTDLCDLAIMAFCQIYPQDYAQFKGRPTYDAKNLAFHIYTPSGSSTSYEVFDIRDNAQVGDRICATIDGDLKHQGKADRLFRILNLTKGEIVFNNLNATHNTIAYTGDFPDDCHLVFNNCSNVYFEWGSQLKPTDGLIEFNNCTFVKSPSRFDKSKTGNYVKVKRN